MHDLVQWFPSSSHAELLMRLLDRMNCSETPDICHANATCSLVSPEVCAAERPISYWCVCNQGYSGDGTDCQGETAAVEVVYLRTGSLYDFYRHSTHDVI